MPRQLRDLPNKTRIHFNHHHTMTKPIEEITEDVTEWVAEEASIPDTGDRTHFGTGAVRDASRGKGLPSNIPTRALRRAARRFEDGAIKYNEHNWRKGIPLSRYIDGLYRHLWAYMEGDRSECHLSAIIWNAMCLSETHDMIACGELPESLNNLTIYKVEDK